MLGRGRQPLRHLRPVSDATPIAENPILLTLATVGILDLLTLLTNWGPCPLAEDCQADLDGDGEVDVVDLLLVLAKWG